MAQSMTHIGVIGAGAFGTALATVAARAGNEVVLWGRNTDAMRAMQESRQHSMFDSVTLPDTIQMTDDLEKVCQADVLINAVPAQSARQMLKQLVDIKAIQSKPIICASKGIEVSTGALMHEVAEAVLPENPFAILSGPGFAGEIMAGLPTAITLACEDRALLLTMQEALSSLEFRVYRSADVTGTQLGGAVKNVLAIACGIAHGKGLGESAKAALMTRGLNELSAICEFKGGLRETAMGLSGIGDILLTCASEKSRNMSFGIALGQGTSLTELLERGTTVEGYATAKSLLSMAGTIKDEIPICQAVYHILYESADIDLIINALLSRPATTEI